MLEEVVIEQPDKEETLAIIRQEKIARWNRFHQRIQAVSTGWGVKIAEILGLIFILVLNLWLLSPFWQLEENQYFFSAPFVPLLAELTSFALPFNSGVRLWLLIFLAGLPISLYFFTRELTGRKLAGFVAAFLISLPIGFFLPLRLDLGIFSSDVSHITSLTIIPLVNLWLLRFLRKGDFNYGLIASFGSALVALTSPFGVLILFCFAGVITFSEMLLGQSRLKAFRMVMAMILTVGFSAFWYNPKFILLTLGSPQGELMRGTLLNLLPPSFFLVPVLAIFGFLIFENREYLQPLFLAVFWAIIFALLSWGGVGIPLQTPSRFLPSLGIALAFLAGISVINVSDFLLASPKLEKAKLAVFRKELAFGFVGLVLVLTLLVIGVAGSRFRNRENSLVLGLKTEQKVGIWEFRDQTSLFESLVGYLITGFTSAGVVVLKKKFDSKTI